MLGSSQSIACPNYILNTIVAESLRQFADVLEPSECFEKDMKELMQKTIKETKQIIFNGNNYSKEWETEAAKRKLLNLKNTPTALARFTDRKNIAVMERHGILTEKELCSRHDILLENYWKTIRIEAYTMLGLAKKQIIPAVYSYYIPLKDGLKENFSPEDTALLKKLSLNKNGLQKKIDELEKKTSYAETLSLEKRAEFYAETILPLMAEVRSYADALEGEIPEKDWPLPAYETILFYV